MKKTIIAGAVFGLIAPFVGIFIGLQVLPLFGTFLILPFVSLVLLTGIPIGNMGTALFVVGMVLSVIFWAVVFSGIGKLVRIVNKG